MALINRDLSYKTENDGNFLIFIERIEGHIVSPELHSIFLSFFHLKVSTTTGRCCGCDQSFGSYGKIQHYLKYWWDIYNHKRFDF